MNAPLGRGGHPFSSTLHPRGRGGKFSAKPGAGHPVGRGGKARTDLPALPTPAQQRTARLRATMAALKQHLAGKVPDSVQIHFFRLFSAYHSSVQGNPMLDPGNDPTAVLDWISNTQTSLRLVGRALAASPDLLHALVHLVAAAERGELSDDELALIASYAP